MKLYTARHSHRHGESIYTFLTDKPFTDEEFIAYLADKYEEREDEFVEVETAEIMVPGGEGGWTPVDNMPPGKDHIRDLGAAQRSVKLLIEAYEANPQQVDWEDVQAALAEALKAVGLPENHLDQFVGYEDETPSHGPGGM